MDAYARKMWWDHAGQETRRWAFYNIGAMMTAQETGHDHAPNAQTFHEHCAYLRGVDDAETAATWTVDGNTDRDAIAQVVAMMDDGAPDVFDYLPAMPDLSGQWADQMNPARL